jgi:hypothetical protein
MKITQNVGDTERKVRIAVGIAMILLAVNQSASGLVGLIGFVLAMTGFLRFCPGYAFLGRHNKEGEEN